MFFEKDAKFVKDGVGFFYLQKCAEDGKVRPLLFLSWNLSVLKATGPSFVSFVAFCLKTTPDRLLFSPYLLLENSRASSFALFAAFCLKSLEMDGVGGAGHRPALPVAIPPGRGRI